MNVLHLILAAKFSKIDAFSKRMTMSHNSILFMYTKVAYDIS